MSDIKNVQTETRETEISDKSLEAAAFAGTLGVIQKCLLHSSGLPIDQPLSTN